MSKTRYKCHVRVLGIKNRCRKSEYHILNLGYEPLDVKWPDVDTKAMEAILKNMKEWKAARVKMVYTTTSDDGFMEEFQMFDERHVEWDVKK